jgi:hypothetical protein
MGMMAWAPGPWQDIGDGDWYRRYSSGEAKYGDSYLWAQWRGKHRLLKLAITHQGRESVSREVLEVRHLPTDGEPMSMLDMIAEGVQTAAHEEWHTRAQALLKVYRDTTAHRLRPPAWLVDHKPEDFGKSSTLATTAREYLVGLVSSEGFDRAAGVWLATRDERGPSLNWVTPTWERKVVCPVLDRGGIALQGVRAPATMLWALSWWFWGVYALSHQAGWDYPPEAAIYVARDDAGTGWMLFGRFGDVLPLDGSQGDCPWSVLARACRAQGWAWAGPESVEALAAMGRPAAQEGGARG